MKVQINNIEFDFHYQGSHHVDDEDNLGIAHLLIPGPMSVRFARECGEDGMLPHYAREDEKVNKESSHDCYNTDTQIVLMHYLFKKQRKYKLEYCGLDPFWLFHDSLHAQNDVYGNEVNNIRSHIERDRLLAGAEFAASKGVHILADTVMKIQDAWHSRWSFWERSSMAQLKGWEFQRFMTPEQVEVFEMLG